MNKETRDQLREELTALGFYQNRPPEDPMYFDDEYLAQWSLAEMLDFMVTRREKLFKAGPVIGEENARQLYDETVTFIAAVVAVINSLEQRREAGTS